jgi:tRNA dimethylallyltransferase
MTTYIICGPTASGKSSLALDMARFLKGQIINADSMQLYKEFPLLSAQPSAADQHQVPHFLYGALSATEISSAGRWLDLTETLLKNPALHTPVVVGGTGLYIKALLEGLSPIPEIPGMVRQEVALLANTLSREDLFRHLQEEDPLTAAQIDPHNTQRILRALEVIRYTQKPLAEWQKMEKEKRIALSLPIRIILIDPDRETLYARINQRTEWMVENGVIEEIKKIKDLPLSSTAKKILGYEDGSAYLDGHLSKGEMIEQIQQKTRQYAKRQMTWFRHQLTPDFIWPKIYEASDWEAFLSGMKPLMDSDTLPH